MDKALNNGSLNSLSGNWSGFSDAASGLASYSYAIGTTSGGTDILTWTANALTTSATPTGLSLSTSVTYYVSVRAADNAGNTVTATSNGQQVAPLGLTLTGLAGGTTSGPHTTNVAAGYTVTTSYTAALTGASTARAYTDIAGSNTTPAAWPGAGTEAFGYSTNATSLPGGTANRFDGGLWAAFASAFAPVVSLTTPTPGTHTTCLAIAASRAANTPADTYQGTIRYTATPTF